MKTFSETAVPELSSGHRAKPLQTWLTMLLGWALGFAASCPAAISTIDFSTGSAGVEEGRAAGAVLSVYRSGSLDESVSVQYATVDGSAIGELDYIPVSGTLTFRPGESMKTITVLGLDDTLAEGTETFTVVLSNPSPNAVLGFNPISYLSVSDNECLGNLVAGTFDPGIGPEPESSYVYAVAVQLDGRILVGGSFSEWNEVSRPSLARLHHDGALDTSFSPNLGTAPRINALLIEPNGKIVVAGLFNLAAHINIVRLNADGSVDDTFAATLPSDVWPASIGQQSDGKILVAGHTSTVGGNRPFMRRFNLSGTRDSNFTLTSLPDSDGIQSILVRPDDRIVAAGRFGSGLGSVILLGRNGGRDPDFATPAADDLQVAFALGLQADGKIVVGGTPNYDGPIPPLLRLNVDGSPDSEFNMVSTAAPGYSTVYALALQEDGRILLAGSFFGIEGQGFNGIARLLPNGSLDSSFFTWGVGGLETSAAYALALETNGTVLVAGKFKSVHEIPRANIARLLPSSRLSTVGFIRPDFYAEESRSAVLYLRRCGDSDQPVAVKYAVHGGTALDNVDFPASSGMLVFAPGENEKTIEVPLLNDNLLEAEEHFFVTLSEPLGDTILSALSEAVVTIRDDDRGPSLVDPTYAQWEIGNASVHALALQSDGKLLAGGDIVWAAGRTVGTVHGILRFQPDGTLDPTFAAPTNIVTSDEQPVTALAVQPDGAILFAGPVASDSSYPTHRLARLDANGTFDSNFAPPLEAEWITSIQLLADGRFLVAGRRLYSTTSHGVVRFRANGTLDPGFAASLVSFPDVNALAVLPDGRLLLGGRWIGAGEPEATSVVRLLANGTQDPTFVSDIAGTPERNVRALQLQPDGKILIAGQFDAVSGLSRTNIARLLPNGAIDPTFAPDTGTDAPIETMLLQPDGRVMIGGSFRLVNGIRLPGLARLNSNGSVDLGFTSQAAPRMFCDALLSQADGRIVAGGSFCRRGPGDDADEFEYCYGVLRLELDPLPRLFAMPSANGPELEIRASVLPGRVYVLEASPDMREWLPRQTNTVLSSSATLQFREQLPTPPSHHFYRLTEQP